MIKHIFKLIWNKKGSNALMILEILLSFLVLFAVLSYVFYNFSVFDKPLGFSTQDRLIVSLDDVEGMDSLEAINMLATLERDLPTLDRVEDVSLIGGITPFGGSTWMTGGDDQDGNPINYRVAFFDENAPDVLDIKVLEGRWFEEGEENQHEKSIIVNKNFVDKYYPGQDVIGKKFDFDEGLKIVGVYEDYRYKGEFEQDEVTVAQYIHPRTEMTRGLIVKLTPNTPASYEEKVFNAVAAITKNKSFLVENLDKLRIENASETWIPVIALLFMCGFLCLNVALGLFGILWFNINKRKPEIGLRRAVGAHVSDIRIHFILEILILTVIGIVIGVFFAIQVPLLGPIDVDSSLFYKAIAYSSLLIIGIVILCALYPSNQASKISPSMALHED